MNGMKTHTIPASSFAEFAAGRGGAGGIALLSAAEYSKHLLLLRSVCDRARALGHGQAEEAGRAYAQLARVQTHAPDVVTDVLSHPSAGAWALHTLKAMGRPSAVEAVPAQLGGLAAAAAIRAGVADEIDVPVIAGAAVLPSLGRITGLEGRKRVRIRSGGSGASVVDRPGRSRSVEDLPGWEPLRRLTVGSGPAVLSLLIEDVDPYRAPGALDLRGRLSGDDVRRWDDLLGPAWEVLTRDHPEVAEEVGACVRTLVPLRPPPVGLTSCTSRETFGSVAASDPPDPVTLAVTLAHEVQHAKLSALLDILPILDPGADATRYYAPWRDDPRPLSGLLQGVYAHLAVVAFWHRHRAVERGDAGSRAHREFARWRDATAEAVRTVMGSGRLTETGVAFVTGISRALSPYLDEPVPSRIAADVRRTARLHRDRWTREHGAPIGG